MYGASVHCPECQSPEVKNIESPPLVNDAIAASIETTSIKPSVKTSTPQVAHERKSNRNISQIEHSRHRNAFNFAVNLMTELIAYTYQEKKLSLHLDPPKCGKGAQTVPERAVWGGIAANKTAKPSA